MRTAEVIKRLLIEQQQLDETVKGLRKFLAQKMVLVDYGVIGWFHVYLALDVRDPNPRIISLDQLGPAYEKLAYGYANPQLVRGMAKEATKTLSRLGFKKQRIVTVLTDITTANHLTGGGTGGYYNRSEHILAINYRTNLADVETWTHEWAHFKMLGGTTTAEQKALVHEIFQEAVHSSESVKYQFQLIQDATIPGFARLFVDLYNEREPEMPWGGYSKFRDEQLKKEIPEDQIQSSYQYHTRLNSMALVYDDLLKQHGKSNALFFQSAFGGFQKLYSVWRKQVLDKEKLLATAREAHIRSLFKASVRESSETDFAHFADSIAYNLTRPREAFQKPVFEALEKLMHEMYLEGKIPSRYGGHNPNEFFAELVAKMATGGHTLDPKLKMIFKRFVSKIQ